MDTYTKWFIARFFKRAVALTILGAPILVFAPFAFFWNQLAALFNRLYNAR